MNKISNVSKGENVALFNNIGIETASLCNRHCFFCPNGYHQRDDKLMSIEMFQHIIKGLKELKYTGRVELYIYNEPTRDKRLVELIQHVRYMLPRTCIMINTNGDYFKGATDILKYFQAGLNQMQINIYSAYDNSPSPASFNNGVAKAKKREALMREWVDYLEKNHEVSTDLTLYQHIGSRKRACKVVAKYGIRKESTSKDVEGVNHFSNRSGNVPGFHEAVNEPLQKMCTRPFRFLNINWKGDSLLCCNDYHGETNFGNVMEKTLLEIWNNKTLNEYRLKLQNKDRSMPLCDKCDFNGGYYPHMINKVTFGEKKDKQILGK